MLKNIKFITLLGIASLALLGCGQKSALYRISAQETNQAATVKPVVPTTKVAETKAVKP